jgi:alpha-beta hydrolase superfamily lysophospholipase
MIKSIQFIVITLVSVLGIIYLLYVSYLYFNQENILFQPEVLAKDHKFTFNNEFEEITLRVEKDVNLHGLLFTAPNSKGLVFYLHGNGGSVDGWGTIAETYTEMGYDIFILDYRGYGKSDGKIKSESQFYEDIKKVYAYMLERYPEDKVVISGYSIGTGPASMLASVNNPKALVLQAPYYSLKETIDGTAPLMPDFLQKYDFETNKFLKEVKAPVCIFHGTADNVLAYTNSEKLKKEFKKGDILITLKGQGHNGITDNMLFKTGFKRFADKALSH